MLLKRVQITGFKSFANKTVFDLESGITAIVGPNGSGKSNVAEAVRWALGEQSRGKLRLDTSEQVIFAGTQKRAKASFAEVALVFDNHDGAIPLELTEVEISRRLYRSGESEYRLAGRSVRLSDISAILASAGLNPGAYTVIGQGMIDTFLLSSPTERKALFDEAAGIRGPELKREAALRKLTATEQNLTRLRDVVAEIEPRLTTLERVVAAAGEQDKLRVEITEQQRLLAAGVHGYLAAETSRLEEATTQALTRIQHAREEQADCTRDLGAMRKVREAAGAELNKLQEVQDELQSHRDALSLDLSQQRATLAQVVTAADTAAGLQSRLEDVRGQLAAARDHQRELEADLATNTTAANRATKAVERASEAVAASQAALVALRQDHADGSRDQYLHHALEVLKALATGLGDSSMSQQQIKLLVHKAGRLLSHAAKRGAAELVTELQAAQRKLETAMTARETATEHQTNVTITRRSLEIDIAHQQETVTRLADDIERLEREYNAARSVANQQADIRSRLTDGEETLGELESRLESARQRLRELNTSQHELTRETDLAARLERATATLATARQEATRASGLLADARKQVAAAQRQAEAWGLNPAELPPAVLKPEAQARHHQRLVQAEATLAAKSSARQDQIIEYDALKKRHTELTSQITDLETAITNLGEVITQLEELIRNRFKDNFRALADRFAEYFNRLFGGGTASLTLQEAPDGSYGIEIQASPKGKRLISLAALSGGERAMAGVALLAAMLRVNPSPFVVLDEIDAALDEANSGRLAGILGELAEHSQLIVITHNRQTMQAASVLFGVTLSDQHVSQLLSIKMEEATALAAR